MKIIPVSIAIFYRKKQDFLELWTQKRLDDGIYHGLLEFPGGKIEEGETPLDAVIREVHEEVGIIVNPNLGKLMGIYPVASTDKTILLNVYIFQDQSSLNGLGEWLKITTDELSNPYRGKIPAPNHQIIDDLFNSIYSLD